ncbi:MAG: response regulator [Proteobacteria bacterium]|nr:response regulator [Pseudomonadota bacterium]
MLTKPVKHSHLFDAIVAVFATAPIAPPALAPVHVTPQDLRILVAEDNSVNQKVARAMLARLGYQPDFVANGHEAVAAVERGEYDLVFMDVQMPELDRLDATRAILRAHPTDRPRICGMTANAREEDRQACFAAGMDDYVAKPVTLDNLQEVLRRAKLGLDHKGRP